MKKIVITIIFLTSFLCFAVKSQQHKNDSIPLFTKGEKLHLLNKDKEGFRTYTFKNSDLKSINLDIIDGEFERDITGDCKIIRFLSFQKKPKDALIFKKHAIKLLEKGDFYHEIFLKNSNSADEVHFYTRGNGYNFSEFHILHYSRNRTSIISYFGNFYLDDLENFSKTSLDLIPKGNI